MNLKPSTNGVVTLNKGETGEIVTPDAVKQSVGTIRVNNFEKGSAVSYKANITVVYNGEEKTFDLMQATSSFFKDLTLRLEEGGNNGVTIHVLFNVQ